MAATRRSLAKPPAVARVLERVTGTARAHDMFRAGETSLVSVSGGPDSVCLLESLVRLRRLFRIRLHVFHLDHRLRSGSAADAAYVARLVERHGIPFHGRVAEGTARPGVSVEAWATSQRWAAASAVAREVGATVLAEGHTLDDQAETVLLNVIRGTGLDGVAGIAPRAGERPGLVVVQPLLEVERAETEACCRALHLRPRRDPTNDDRRLLRAAIRHDVMPSLERAVGRDVRGPLARTAENLRSDREELERATAAARPRVVAGDREHGIRVDVDALSRLSPALARRVIRAALYDVHSSDDPAPWSKEAIEAVLDLARGRPGRRRDLPNGSTAVRERGYVHVFFAAPSL